MKAFRRFFLRLSLGKTLAELDHLGESIEGAKRRIDWLLQKQGRIRMELTLLDMNRPPISRTHHPLGGTGAVRSTSIKEQK
jgi:hypothetical protein